jgi:mono/diheme cytochrome c family protein
VRRARAAALALVAAAPALSAETPQVLYMLHCQGCHLPDGAGTAGAVPPLCGEVARFVAVPGGREYLVRVPGVALAPLADAPLAQVLNWMVERFGPAEAARGFAPYTADEVGAARRAPLVDVEPERRELLRLIERRFPSARPREVSACP